MSRRPDGDHQRPATGIILFLAGPVIWYVCFWLVYLIAETACTQDGLRFRALGLEGVSVVTVGLSVLAIVVVAVLVVVAYRRLAEPNESQDPVHVDGDDGTNRLLLYWGGAILGALFALGILMVGIPALVLTPC